MSSLTTERFLSLIGINNPGAQAKLIQEGYLTETDLRSAPPLKEDFKNYGFNDFQRNKILQQLGKKESNDSLSPTKRAFVIGTFDTKQTELLYVSHLLEKVGVPTVLVDVGLRSEDTVAHVTAQEVANHHPKGSSTIFPATDRNKSTLAMSLALEHWIQTRDDVGGVIAVGGSCGTSLTTRAMRALPLGIPKVMVSTLASGDVGEYVGTADITMVHSVVDVIGINQISAKVLGNAANALAGMITLPLTQIPYKPAIALTAFGVTTACVTRIVSEISGKYEPLVFHAVGKGGQSVDSLVKSGLVAAVVDVTTTEECDELMGGVFSSGPERLAPLVCAGIPYVGSCGALDMVNFHARESVPERYRQRLLYEHNPQVTLMRTTREENILLGKYIGKKLNTLVGPVRFLIPEKGVSALDKQGMPFFDPEADEALFRTLEETVLPTENRRLVRVPYHINDPEFADEVVKHFIEIVGTPTHVPLFSGDSVKGEVVEGRKDQGSATSLVPLPQALYLPQTRPRFDRSTLVQKFRDMAKNRTPIIGGGAGIGLAAKSEEKGGIDLIIIYNSGRYRMAGRGSLAGLLPYGNANDIVLDMAREVLPVVKNTPVLAGVNGTDPFMILDHFLEQIKALGFAGIQNFPTVGLMDGKYRANLEETGMGYGVEVELIRAAHSHGLLTSPYIFSAADGVAMAKAGADILVAHMGLTTGGTIGAQTSLKVEECPAIVDEWATAALRVNPDILVLCHGGPIATPSDAEYVLQKCKHCHGFYGASSMERLPTEVAIEEQTRKFKNIKF